MCHLWFNEFKSFLKLIFLHSTFINDSLKSLNQLIINCLWQWNYFYASLKTSACVWEHMHTKQKQTLVWNISCGHVMPFFMALNELCHHFIGLVWLNSLVYVLYRDLYMMFLLCCSISIKWNEPLGKCKCVLFSFGKRMPLAVQICCFHVYVPVGVWDCCSILSVIKDLGRYVTSRMWRKNIYYI